MSNIVLALDAACEIQALMSVVAREASSRCPNTLVIRGVSARVLQLAGAMVEVLHEGDPADLERLSKMIGG